MRYLFVMLPLFLLTVSCTTTPEPDPPPKVKLTDLKGKLLTPVIGKVDQVDSVAFAVAQRLDFPLDVDLDTAWAMTDQSGFDPARISALNHNAIRAGVLNVKELEAFAKALPRAVHGHRWAFNAHDRYSAIALSPVFTRTAHIEYAIDAETTRPLRLTRGRCQFLARFTKAEEKQFIVHLAPQHHVPKATLKPRPAHVELLDGRIFQELALRTQIGAEHLLIVGLNLPKPKIVEEDDTAKEIDEAEGEEKSDEEPSEDDTENEPEPGEEPKPVKKPAVVLPKRIGSLFCAASRFGKPVQSMLLLRLVPLDQMKERKD